MRFLDASASLRPSMSVCNYLVKFTYVYVIISHYLILGIYFDIFFHFKDIIFHFKDFIFDFKDLFLISKILFLISKILFLGNTVKYPPKSRNFFFRVVIKWFCHYPRLG